MNEGFFFGLLLIAGLAWGAAYLVVLGLSKLFKFKMMKFNFMGFGSDERLSRSRWLAYILMIIVYILILIGSCYGIFLIDTGRI